MLEDLPVELRIEVFKVYVDKQTEPTSTPVICAKSRFDIALHLNNIYKFHIPEPGTDPIVPTKMHGKKNGSSICILPQFYFGNCSE